MVRVPFKEHVMTTTRARTGIAAAIIATIVAASGPVLADPPAKPAADKKADKPAAPATPAAPAAPAAPDKSEKKEPVSEADAKRFVEFFDKLVAIVVANQEDCAKMAAGINAHIDANQPLIKEMSDPKNRNKELPQAVRDRIQKKVRDELTPAITKKCSTDKGVEAAFNRMEAGRAK
jgi:hypothetical protein